VAGTYSLRVKCEGQHIKNSPFTVNIVPGPISAGKVVATGDGLSKAVAGEPANFTVHAKDSFGNSIKTGGAKFDAVLEGREKVNVDVQDKSDGTYSASYKTAVSGAYFLHVTLEGTPIKDSPFSVNVTPGAASASLSSAEGEGLIKAIAGETATFVVSLKDSYGNPLKASGGDVAAQVDEANECSVYDNKDGTYRAQYRATKSGQRTINVTVNGSPIAGSPFTAVVEPATASPTHSYVVGEIPQGVAGQAAKFTIQTADAFGNPLTKGGVAFECTIEGPVKSTARVTDNNDGSYTAEYTLDKAGEYKIYTAFATGGEI